MGFVASGQLKRASIMGGSPRFEVYVQPFFGPGGKWQISTERSNEPVWSCNGQELFYQTGEQMIGESINTQPGFSAGNPKLLCEGEYYFEVYRQLDITPDGQRFVMIKWTTRM